MLLRGFAVRVMAAMWWLDVFGCGVACVVCWLSSSMLRPCLYIYRRPVESDFLARTSCVVWQLILSFPLYDFLDANMCVLSKMIKGGCFCFPNFANLPID